MVFIIKRKWGGKIEIKKKRKEEEILENPFFYVPFHLITYMDEMRILGMGEKNQLENSTQ